MSSYYSYVHRQPGYWKVRYDSAKGWEGPHIHVSQGDRELQVYTNTLDIRHQDGRFSDKGRIRFCLYPVRAEFNGFLSFHSG